MMSYRAFLKSPEGAQFNSTGHRPVTSYSQRDRALKGRNKAFAQTLYCALSGLVYRCAAFPGASRRAIELRPFRALIDYDNRLFTSNAYRTISLFICIALLAALPVGAQSRKPVPIPPADGTVK